MPVLRTDERPKPMNSRAVAADILARWMIDLSFPDRMVETVVKDRAFVMEVVYGAVRRHGTLAWMVDQFTGTPPPPPVCAVLHTGLYQLFFMDRVDAFAAVHETVEAARWLGLAWAARMVNAVLRRAQRERNEVLLGLRRQPASVRLSHPAGLIERWEREFGQARAHRLCEWNNDRPDVCLRMRPGAPPAAEYVHRLHAKGIEATPHPFAPSRFVRIGHGIRIPDLPGFEEGWFYAQDPSTSVAPDLLDPKPGEAVLDACAAPGGKAVILAERLDGRGSLTALDPHEDRLVRLRENLRRLGLPWVGVVRGDATSVDAAAFQRADPPAPGEFDAILLDVPCSNTGVIRRRPDARWSFTPQRVERLVHTQAALLDRAATLLRPGGRIVYSTCSLEREENGDAVRSFLARAPRFTLVSERVLFPPDTATDGAYAALLAAPRGAPEIQGSKKAGRGKAEG